MAVTFARVALRSFVGPKSRRVFFCDASSSSSPSRAARPISRTPRTNDAYEVSRKDGGFRFSFVASEDAGNEPPLESLIEDDVKDVEDLDPPAEKEEASRTRNRGGGSKDDETSLVVFASSFSTSGGVARRGGFGTRGGGFGDRLPPSLASSSAFERYA